MFDFDIIQQEVPQITGFEIVPPSIKRKDQTGSYETTPVWILFFVGSDGYYIMPDDLTDTQDIIDCLKTVIRIAG